MRRSRLGRRGRRDRRGQGTTEYIILAALAGLVLTWAVTRLPRAITSHYKENVRILAAPF